MSNYNKWGKKNDFNNKYDNYHSANHHQQRSNRYNYQYYNNKYYYNNDYYYGSSENNSEIKKQSQEVQEEIEKAEEEVLETVKGKIDMVNKEISHLILRVIKDSVKFQHKPLSERFLEVAKSIKHLLKSKTLSINLIADIIGEVSKETKNPVEILNLVCYYHELQKSFNNYKNYTLSQYLKRDLSATTFSITNPKYLNEILKFKVLIQKTVTKEEYNKIEEDMRRPILLDKNQFFSYLPINCKSNMGFCSRIYKSLKKNSSNLNAEDVSLCLGFPKNYDYEHELRMNCILSHNVFEEIYHPLNYKTTLCQNGVVCKDNPCTKAHREEELVLLYNKQEYEPVLKQLAGLLDPSNNTNGLLYNHFLNKSNPEHSVPDSIFLIKTLPCKNKNLCQDFKSCFYYHNALERRRDPSKVFNTDNSICEEVFTDKKWLDPNRCLKGDKCPKFHTKNELMYDNRNFRRLTVCEIEKVKKFCPYMKFCYHKHVEDIEIDCLYVSESDKKLLKKELNKLQKRREEYSYIRDIVKHYSCLSCHNIIKNSQYILKCQHYFCNSCFDKLCSEFNSTCSVCKATFIEKEKKVYFVAKLLSSEEIDQLKKFREFAENIPIKNQIEEEICSEESQNFFNEESFEKEVEEGQFVEVEEMNGKKNFESLVEIKGGDDLEDFSNPDLMNIFRKPNKK